MRQDYYQKIKEGLTVELITPSGDRVTLVVVGKDRNAAGKPAALSLRITGERSGLEIRANMGGVPREAMAAPEPVASPRLGPPIRRRDREVSR